MLGFGLFRRFVENVKNPLTVKFSYNLSNNNKNNTVLTNSVEGGKKHTNKTDFHFTNCSTLLKIYIIRATLSAISFNIFMINDIITL